MLERDHSLPCYVVYKGAMRIPCPHPSTPTGLGDAMLFQQKVTIQLIRHKPLELGVIMEERTPFVNCPRHKHKALVLSLTITIPFIYMVLGNVVC